MFAKAGEEQVVLVPDASFDGAGRDGLSAPGLAILKLLVTGWAKQRQLFQIQSFENCAGRRQQAADAPMEPACAYRDTGARLPGSWPRNAHFSVFSSHGHLRD